MTRLLLAALAIALALPTAASAGDKPSTKSAQSERAEKDVLATLETWRQAMLTKDPAAFDRVFHPELSYGHSIGLIENKTQATDHVLKSTTIYKVVVLSETKVSFRGDTAFVTGKMHYEKHPKGAPVLHQHLSVLSVFVKTPKGWQMIARQSTEPKPAPQVAQGK